MVTLVHKLRKTTCSLKRHSWNGNASLTLRFSRSQLFISYRNPVVGKDCSGLWAKYAYCVGTKSNSPTRSSSSQATTKPPTSTSSSPAVPSPTQANNIISSCNKYAKALDTNDNCADFAKRNGITTANLYSWNAVLGSNGQNCQTQFWAKYYYCVGVKK